MKKHLYILPALILGLALTTTHAQPGPRGRGMGGPPAGPQFGGDLGKILGEHKAFSANLEFHMNSGKAAEEVTMPGKLAYLDGKSRFEMNMAEMKSAQMPPEAAAQMKQMGMDKTIAIGRPDKKITYLVYPGMESYVENPIRDAEATKPESDFTIEVTKIGKETVDGHDCVKNKVVSTDKEGKTHESTVWNATDLKNFPVKIETAEQGNTVTMRFKDVKFAKPEAAQFDPPANLTKYDNMMSMMQEQMMKRMGGGAIPKHPGQ